MKYKKLAEICGNLAEKALVVSLIGPGPLFASVYPTG